MLTAVMLLLLPSIVKVLVKASQQVFAQNYWAHTCSFSTSSFVLCKYRFIFPEKLNFFAVMYIMLQNVKCSIFADSPAVVTYFNFLACRAQSGNFWLGLNARDTGSGKQFVSMVSHLVPVAVQLLCRLLHHLLC